MLIEPAPHFEGRWRDPGHVFVYTPSYLHGEKQAVTLCPPGLGGSIPSDGIFGEVAESGLLQLS